jgi:alkanesulfonate monooxygenase SsuD/methylene tetrahydromethanopterin reductase-like flavin-dependent oxidoreductase (luciferase family)
MTLSIAIPTVNLGRDHLTRVFPRSIILEAHHGSSGRANFFPSCRPERKSADVFFREALDLCEIADTLGFATVKIVEHYVQPYGGYSPSPLIFLAAAAQRTRQIRLVTGAVLPAFNHPLKLAAELAMVDCLSGGRLDAGFTALRGKHRCREAALDGGVRGTRSRTRVCR